MNTSKNLKLKIMEQAEEELELWKQIDPSKIDKIQDLIKDVLKYRYSKNQNGKQHPLK